MKLSSLFPGSAQTSLYLKMAIVLLIILAVLFVFPQAVGVQADLPEVTATSAGSSSQFAILYKFLAVLIVMLYALIGVSLWIRRKQEAPGAVSMLAAFGNLPASAAMETSYATLTSGDSLDTAVNSTLAGSQQDFPVVEGGRLVGMLSQRDLFAALKQDSRIRVASIMRRQFPIVDPQDRMEDALNRLRGSGLRALPVMDSRQLFGLFTAENAQEFLTIASARGRVCGATGSNPSLLGARTHETEYVQAKG